jgi:hypothetical protein
MINGVFVVLINNLDHQGVRTVSNLNFNYACSYLYSFISDARSLWPTTCGDSFALISPHIEIIRDLYTRQ